jgi:protoporphyrinogen oxidase
LAAVKAGLDFLAARITLLTRSSNFETFAIASYGRYIAERFLLGYSQKLWGAPPRLLAPEIAGKRLQGLNLRTFILEAFQGKGAATEHLDGAFYYPQKNGIGAIAESLQDYCGRKTIRLHTEVTRVFQHAGSISAVEFNGCDRVEVEEVVSSIPITTLLSCLEPPPPVVILEASRRLRFRNLILVALFLKRPGITPNASIYFPDPEFPFTRVYEPKNRSLSMSPSGQTSLVAEIPCQPTDLLWKKNDSELQEAFRSALCRSGFLHESDITDATVVRLVSAYPIIEKTSVKERLQVHHYLEGFSNLSLTGRNGLFLYTHIHDQMKQGKEIIERFMNAANQRTDAPVETRGSLANKIY